MLAGLGTQEVQIILVVIVDCSDWTLLESLSWTFNQNDEEIIKLKREGREKEADRGEIQSTNITNKRGGITTDPTNTEWEYGNVLNNFMSTHFIM